MNVNIACYALDIKQPYNITTELIKKQYRYKALQYHPDKNKHPDANQQFQEIRDAYEFLNKYVGENETVNVDTYAILLQEFLNCVLNNDIGEFKSTFIHKIIQTITNTCEEKALKILRNVDKRLLIEIYKLLDKYKTLLEYSNTEFLEKIKKMILNKNADECIILNPSLGDLLECNLYKLTKNGRTHLIPLWHREVVYDNSGSDFYVQCIPELDDNLFIDECNNIHMQVKYNIKDLWNTTAVPIEIGKKIFTFDPSLMELKESQHIVLKHVGIPLIDTNDIYNVDDKADIILHINVSVNDHE